MRFVSRFCFPIFCEIPVFKGAVKLKFQKPGFWEFQKPGFLKKPGFSAIF